jgi:hypothetical protein
MDAARTSWATATSIKVLAPFNSGSDRFGTQSRANDVLHVGNQQAVARQPVPVGNDVEEIDADHALGVDARGPINGLYRFFNITVPAVLSITLGC